MLSGMGPSIDSVLDVHPARLDHDGRLDLLVEIERVRAAIDAQAQQTLALLAGDGDAESRAKEWVREEVAAALRIAPVTAAARLHDALDLVIWCVGEVRRISATAVAARQAAQA